MLISKTQSASPQEIRFSNRNQQAQWRLDLANAVSWLPKHIFPKRDTQQAPKYINFQNAISRPAHKLISKTQSARPQVFRCKTQSASPQEFRFSNRNQQPHEHLDLAHAVSRPQKLLTSKTQSAGPRIC